SGNGGVPGGLISDPQELGERAGVFARTPRGAVGERPGTRPSLTHNLPPPPPGRKHPTPRAPPSTPLPFAFPPGRPPPVLLAFGRFDYLGWHRSEAWPPHTQALRITDAQRATLKFMAVAALLFFGQTLIGGGIAHYRADPGSFYGIDLSVFLPSNLLRTW